MPCKGSLSPEGTKIQMFCPSHELRRQQYREHSGSTINPSQGAPPQGGLPEVQQSPGAWLGALGERGASSFFSSSKGKVIPKRIIK